MGSATDDQGKDKQAASTVDAPSKWRSPLVVAVLAAGAAGLSNAGVAYLNGQNQSALEASKAETTLILEMIKTGGNPDRAAENLRFLVDAGLISEPGRVAQIRRYLVSRAPGTGVTLPTGTDRFRIQGNAALGESANASLKSQLAAFAQYLASLGFVDTAKLIEIEVDEDMEVNAYYDTEKKRMVISAKIVNDKHVPLYTYALHVLDKRNNSLNESTGYQQIGAALSDYFPSSYLDNPLVGQEIAKILTPGNTSLRNLDNRSTFIEIQSCQVSDTLRAGEIWGGAFWEIRKKLGKSAADRLLSTTWRTTPPSDGPTGFAQVFVENLQRTANKSLLAEEAKAVVDTLRARKLIDVKVLRANACT